MISLNELAGVKTLPGVGSSATAFDWNNLGQAALGMTGRGLVNAGISTAINGGSFGAAFRQSLVGDLAAVGANGIGTAWGGGTNPAMQTATHGLLGCAAAEARGKDCASGAIGGMSESLLGNAIDRFGRLPTDANGEYSKGTRALYTGGAMLLADIVTHAAGRDTLTAMDAARNAATNNYLSNWQKAAYDKEIRACKDDLACKVGASVRWGATSVKQDAALVSGMALGATFEVKDAVAALAELPRTIEMLANDPALLKTLPDGYLKGLQTSYRNYQTALETAGVDGATAAGVEFTHLLTQLALIPATVATGGAAAGYTIGKTAGLLGKLGAEGTTLAKVPGVVSGARGAAAVDGAGVAANTGASETQVFAKFAENAANRTYRSLDLAINERGLLAQERSLAEAAGWKRADGSTWWPPYEGSIPGTQRVISLEPGGAGSVNLVDRYGRTAGTYVSPAGLSLESRSLSYAPASPPSMYSVDAVIGGVERSTIAPWFGQKGLGVQYKLPNSVQYYLDTMKFGEMK